MSNLHKPRPRLEITRERFFCDRAKVGNDIPDNTIGQDFSKYIFFDYLVCVLD